MATEYVISIKVTGNESASGPLGAVGGALGRIGELLTAGIIFRGLERLTEALGDAGRAAWGNATGFQTLMSRVAGLTDTTLAESVVMGQGAVAMSKDMRQTATDLADAMYFIASSGFAGTQALDILKASARAASAGLGETKTVADAVTSALNAYKLKASDAAWVTDILTEAVVQGKGEPAALAGSIGRVLPIAAAAGVSFAQVTASLATMTRSGLNAEEAATALRGMLGNLFAPAKQTRDALDLLGWSADDLRKSIRERGLLVTLNDLMARTGGNIEMLDMLIPNIRALTGFLSTASGEGSQYADVLAAIEASTGRTDRAFVISSQTWEFQWARLKNVLLALPITVGEKVLPGLTGALNAITAEIDRWAGPLADKISGPLQGIATRLRVAAEAGGIEGVIGEIGKMLGEGWNRLVVPKIKEWTASFWTWVWGEGGVQASVPQVLSLITDGISKFLTDDWPKIEKTLNTWGAKFFAWVSTVVVPQIKEKMNLVASGLSEWAEKSGNQAKIEQIGVIVGQELVDGFRTLCGAVETWTPVLLDMSSALAEAGGKVLLPAMVQIGGSFGQGLIEGIASGLGMSIEESKLLAASGRGQGFSGPIKMLLSALLPGRQYGGEMLAGLPYLVGERGPEMFMPRQSGTVISNSNTFNLQPTQYRSGSRSLSDEVRMLQMLYGTA